MLSQQATAFRLDLRTAPQKETQCSYLRSEQQSTAGMIMSLQCEPIAILLNRDCIKPLS